MAGKVVGLFTDVSNLYYCISKKFLKRKLHYGKYLDKAVGDNQLYRAFAYGYQMNDEAVHFIAALRHLGYDPKYKKIDSQDRRTDWNVGLALDVVRLIEKLDIVVIGSASGDLAPLVRWIKERGVRCVILASGINRDLKEAADQWLEITEDLLEDIPESKERNESGAPS